MKYVTAKGQKLSMFSLGAVQLGMAYGLAANKEKPSEEDAFALLDRAMELGVDNLDTANNYGDSEAVIGRWMAKRKAEGKDVPWVATKIGPLKLGSPDILRDDILYQTEGCLKSLGVDTIDCLMVHQFEDYDSDRDTVRKVFEELKSQNVYRYNGISVYSRHDYGTVAESGFDSVQIPLNIFDWSQIDNGGIEKLKDAGMMVFVRSAFMQGLIFRKPEDLDPRMDFCFPYLNRYRELCEEFKMEPAVLALSFVLSIPGVSTAVLGCRNIRQVESNCQLIEKAATLTADQMALLREAFQNTDPRVTNPQVWYNKW